MVTEGNIIASRVMILLISPWRWTNKVNVWVCVGVCVCVCEYGFTRLSSPSLSPAGYQQPNVYV